MTTCRARLPYRHACAQRRNAHHVINSRSRDVPSCPCARARALRRSSEERFLIPAALVLVKHGRDRTGLASLIRGIASLGVGSGRTEPADTEVLPRQRRGHCAAVLFRLFSTRGCPISVISHPGPSYFGHFTPGDVLFRSFHTRGHAGSDRESRGNIMCLGEATTSRSAPHPWMGFGQGGPGRSGPRGWEIGTPGFRVWSVLLDGKALARARTGRSGDASGSSVIAGLHARAAHGGGSRAEINGSLDT